MVKNFHIYIFWINFLDNTFWNRYLNQSFNSLSTSKFCKSNILFFSISLVTQSHICIFSGLPQWFLRDDGSILHFMLRLNIEAQNVNHEKKNNRIVSGCLQSSEVADQLLRTNTRHEQASEEQSPEILKHNVFPLTKPFEVTIFSKPKHLPYRTHSTFMSDLSYRLPLSRGVLTVTSQLHHVTENATSVQIIPISSYMHFQIHQISWSCSIN